MRLVVATPLYPPEGGGPATYAKALEDELPSRGWDIELVKFRDVRHWPKGIRHCAYAWRVYKAARHGDMVIVLDPVSTGIPALIGAKLARKPFFVRVAGDYAWEQGTQRFHVREVLDEFVQRRDYALPVRVMKWMQTLVARHAVRVIVPSEYLKRIVEAWGIPADKIRVVYNAAPTITEVAAAPVSGEYLVSIARLVPWKGMDMLIRAVGRIADARLIIVGGGPERAKLEGIVDNLDLGDRVSFTGNLPHEETLAYLAHASAYILNTRYEGLSHLILEAMALKVPVATTPLGGNPELIEDDVTGLLFPYGDVAAIEAVIERMRKDAPLCKKLADAAYEKANTFTRERMISDSLSALTL